jgi:two-component system, response regulator, stage 0 sporulation protein A
MKQTIRILIVDDNIEFGDSLHKYLSSSEDFKVVGVARDGIQAIEMIKTLTPDMVILDIIMPNLDGIGVLENFTTIKEKPLFIVLSGIGQDVFIQKSMSLGAQYYIIKPFDVDILVLRIKQIFMEKNISSFSNKKISNMD